MSTKQPAKTKKAPTIYERKCKECGEAFIARRSDKVFCSVACLKRDARKRAKALEPDTELGDFNPTEPSSFYMSEAERRATRPRLADRPR